VATLFRCSFVVQSVQVVIELGHRATFLEEPTREGFTHNWTLFVHGARKNDISHFVDKVVFYLHDSFKPAKRGYTFITFLLLVAAVKNSLMCFSCY